MLFPNARLTTALAVLGTSWTASAHKYSSNSTACTRYYQVAAGDTCDIIGQKTWTSTYQILAYNLPEAGATCETLENGANLCLGRYGNDCQAVHRCTNSDTCNGIAARYSISQSLLEDNNPSLDCNEVYDGLVLCVAPGVMRPPPLDALSPIIHAQKSLASQRTRLGETVGDESSAKTARRDAEIQVDSEAIEALQTKVRNADGASRQARGIQASILSHHS